MKRLAFVAAVLAVTACSKSDEARKGHHHSRDGPRSGSGRAMDTGMKMDTTHKMTDEEDGQMDTDDDEEGARSRNLVASLVAQGRDSTSRPFCSPPARRSADRSRHQRNASGTPSSGRTRR